MELTENLKSKIDGMDYHDMLYEWRFAPHGSDIFQGDSGLYYANAMNKKRAALDTLEAAFISKCVGWEKR